MHLICKVYKMFSHSEIIFRYFIQQSPEMVSSSFKWDNHQPLSCKSWKICIYKDCFQRAEYKYMCWHSTHHQTTAFPLIYILLLGKRHRALVYLLYISDDSLQSQLKAFEMNNACKGTHWSKYKSVPFNFSYQKHIELSVKEWHDMGSFQSL
jgi:hypothetical protein